MISYLNYLGAKQNTISVFSSDNENAFNLIFDGNASFNANDTTASPGMCQPVIEGHLRLKITNGLFEETFDTFDNLVASDCTNIHNESNKIRMKYEIYIGDGRDGNITISGTKNINTDVLSSSRTLPDAPNYSVINLSATTARLSTTPTVGAINAGDEILLINLMGTGSYYANVGNFETLRVKSISGDIITFTTKKTKYYGSGSSDDLNIGVSSGQQRVMIQRIPNYNNVTIDMGNTLTASAFDEYKGGVLFFRVKGILDIWGTVDMNYKGYLPNGESIWGYGGVGNSGNRAAGGSYVTGTNGAHGEPTLQKIYLGSSGYAGGHGGAGRNGGGIIYIASNDFQMRGLIRSNGQKGDNGLPYAGGYPSYGGGGGAGGSIRLMAISATLGTHSMYAQGGAGGAEGAYPGEAGLPGSVGRVAYYYKTQSGTISCSPASYSAATTPVCTFTRFRSINVLQDHAVSNIKQFSYFLDAKPMNTEAFIQFSQDTTNQYSATGTLNEKTQLVLNQGNISLEGLDQTSSVLYYRIDMSSNGDDSPILDRLFIDYDPDTYATGLQQWQSNTIDSKVGANLVKLLFMWDNDPVDNIYPKIQLMGSNTGSFTGEEIVFPNGSDTYFQHDGYYSIDNGIPMSLTNHIGENYYRYQKVKAYMDAGSNTANAPRIRNITAWGQLKDATVTAGNILADSTNISLSEITQNTSSKLCDNTITIIENKKVLVICEAEVDATGFDTTNGVNVSMQICRDDTQLDEKLTETITHKHTFVKTIIEQPPSGLHNYQIYASENDDKTSVKVNRAKVRVMYLT